MQLDTQDSNFEHLKFQTLKLNHNFKFNTNPKSSKHQRFNLGSGTNYIDECADITSTRCSETCINTPGGYNCSCPKGYHGDGWLNGTSCVRDSVSDHPNVAVYVSATLGSLLLPPIGWWLFIVIRKRKAIKQKARNFQKNGGLLLQHRMSSDEHIVERTHFFTIDELEKATDHFNESRILGRGGQGIVYKGMLGEGRLIAVKKSKTLNESQQADFINEVVIMSQIIHRNIVRLLGCCLESKVPLLVYEFVPNGTLFNHLHHLNEEFPITWRMRLQIASDLAGALAYLHSFSYVPILHRDIKSSNILLDDKYRAKLSDFGLSKSVAPDQTHVTTRVMGTFGYLDPEYSQTHRYTEKSDVYSFGVVLVELITGQKAIRAISDQDRSLVSWFLSHMENSQFLDMVDPQSVKESLKEEIYTIADLATRCLNPKGTRRPTMKEVLLVLGTEESPQTNVVEKNSQFEQVLDAGTTNNSYHENVATSSTFSMDTRYCQSAELSLLFNPR
ncbi:putative wall-associated receptor kinase-like 11 [Chenopodium quinoa]|uniref:putative wall-associated receptor kinase-like 11 n=1 Tax=Chenopodium quinoa TaxID=63459 RepID=UPI000B772493|nr:putative wall-associated receptor kinase-like 11 [Chenopodium quinoa]